MRISVLLAVDIMVRDDQSVPGAKAPIQYKDDVLPV